MYILDGVSAYPGQFQLLTESYLRKSWILSNLWVWIRPSKDIFLKRLFDLFVLFVHIVRMQDQKRSKKIERSKAADAQAAGDSKSSATSGFETHLQSFVHPPPDILLKLAMEEPDRQLLQDYDQVIRALRDEKRFTFREIAVWMQRYGFDVDHSAVYRQYCKGLPEDVVAEMDNQPLDD
jgi:hypothetical protein